MATPATMADGVAAPAAPAPAPARKPKGRKILRTLGSLKMAVCMILSIAAYSFAGMFYEGSHGTAAVRDVFWGAWYFDILLGLLGVNIACAALVRYPWPRRLTGFVITHAGLLVLLLGSGITRRGGEEGQVRLFEGQRTETMLEMPMRWVLEVRFADGSRVELPADGLRARVGHAPERLPGTAWALAVDEWMDASQEIEEFVSDPGGVGAPAVRVDLQSPMFGAQQIWLAPTDPDRARASLGPLTLLARWLPDAAAEGALGVPEPPPREYRVLYDVPPDATRGAVRVVLPDGREIRLEGTDAAGVAHALPDGAEIRIERFLANAQVATDEAGRSVLVDTPEAKAGPAVEARITWAGGAQDHAAFARFPQFPSRRGAGSEGHGSHGAHGDAPAGNTVVVGLTPDGRVLASLRDPAGRETADARPLARGTWLETPWAGMRLTLGESLRSAHPVRRLVPAQTPADPTHAIPAARVRLSGGGAEGRVWLQEGAQVPCHVGDAHVNVGWRLARRPLGFALALEDFRKVDYPGTSAPASFESDVRVFDALRPGGEKVRIQMNEPLVHGATWWWPGSGYTFYQSSYEQQPGAPEASVFQVAHDPGFPVVMIGSILIVFGIFTMFYLVPYFGTAPRRARTTEAA